MNTNLEHLSFKSEALGDVIMCGHQPKAPFHISFLLYLVSVSLFTYLSVSAMDFVEKGRPGSTTRYDWDYSKYGRIAFLNTNCNSTYKFFYINGFRCYKSVM